MSEHDEALEFDDAEPEPYMAGMLAAYREEEDIPSDVKARVQRRLESAPMVAAAEPASKSSRGLWIGVAVAAVLAAIVIAPRLGSDATGVAGTSAEYQGTKLAPTEETVSPAIEAGASAHTHRHAEPDAEIDPTDDASIGASDEADTDASESPAGARSGVRRKRGGGRPSLEPREQLSLADSLAEETALLRRSQAALSEGDPRGALSTLREYEQRFPDGVLAEERRALTAVALCDDGQVARGRAEARTFLSKHPGSALRDRVATACPEGDR